jgi:hypothetical protein
MCPAGTYGDEGGSLCTKCPADTYGSSDADGTIDSCLACEPGSTSAPGSTECRLPTTISVDRSAALAAAILEAGTGDTVELASERTFDVSQDETLFIFYPN